MYVRCLLRVPDVSEKPLLAACNALQPLQVEPSHVTPIASYQKANLKMACCHVPVSVGQRLRYMRHPSFIHARAVLLHMAPFSCAHQTGGRNQCDTCGAHHVSSSFCMWHGLPYTTSPEAVRCDIVFLPPPPRSLVSVAAGPAHCPPTLMAH